jgi:hypothetical protein
MTRYMSQRPNRAAAVMYLGTGGPPSSPPMALFLRMSKIMMAIRAPEQKIVTEKAKLKVGRGSLIEKKKLLMVYSIEHSLSRWHFEVPSI